MIFYSWYFFGKYQFVEYTITWDKEFHQKKLEIKDDRPSSIWFGCMHEKVGR